MSEQKEAEKEPESKDWTGIWIGAAMVGGTALLLIVGWLGRGSVTL